ncbi:DHHC zinc finger domain containing protein [Tritrichomonas foetus]|uniref:Palmitoyltransferase n=1 Tax=Tritrichomonas foetus TaxID=1144522 RepID=A0A1J4K714_9EUKA|nr:DHHC zinc finger domain containing protein [Tritrichomonas foetus]|eukprot:OHT06979.1 DHHC zinc finger domain containing protein [Tritrichomonas foetus]
MPKNYDQQEPVNHPVSFPGSTEYKRHKFIGINFISIPSINSFFFGHWEIRLFYPFLVLSLIFSSFGVAQFLIIPSYVNTKIFLYLILFILFSLTIISYFQVIKTGPGYFPFYFPLKSHQVPNTTNNQNSQNIQDHSNNQNNPIDKHNQNVKFEKNHLFYDQFNDPAGILSNETQSSWRVQQKRPNRCIFSKTARRYVIRPDHFCYWVSSWIGKKNQKLFAHFTFWCSAYLLSFLVIDIGMFLNPIPLSALNFWIFFVYACAACFFLLMCLWFFAFEMDMICHNYTHWEELNQIPSNKYDTGSCMKNYEDVCGPKTEMWKWFLPLTPFKTKNNFDLIQNYSSYDQNSLTLEEEDINEPKRVSDISVHGYTQS